MSKDFETSLKELESAEGDKINKIQEVVDSASPEEIAAMLEPDFEEEEAEEGPERSEEDKAAGETEKGDKSNKSEEGSEESEEEEEIEDQDKGKEQPPANGPIQITDDYISKADEKDRTILQSIKGETFSPKALQNYLSAQRKIGELGQKIGQQPKTENEKETGKKKLIPDEFPKQQLTAEIQQLKDQEVTKRLQKDFRDLPDNLEERKEYLVTLSQSDPEGFWDYREKKREIEKTVSAEFDKAIYIQEHQPEINQNVIAGDIQKIQEELKEYGIEDPAKVGLDFTVTKGADGKSSNALIMELITTPDGKLDPNVVTYFGNVPIFNEGALFNKFFFTKGKIVRDILKTQTGIKARKEAFDELGNKTKVADNTASVQKGDRSTSGAKPAKKSLAEMTEDEISKLSPAQIAALKKESDAALFGES